MCAKNILFQESLTLIRSLSPFQVLLPDLKSSHNEHVSRSCLFSDFYDVNATTRKLAGIIEFANETDRQKPILVKTLKFLNYSWHYNPPFPLKH